MKLSATAIMVLRGSDTLRIHIAKILDVSINTVNRWVRDNDDSLTKAAALDIIRKETGLEDSQILEETEVRA